MDDNDELDTIVMEDEDEAEVKEEDEEQELIIIPFKETCSKHIRGFRRHSCLYKYRLICAWQQNSRQTCTHGLAFVFYLHCEERFGKQIFEIDKRREVA